MIRTRLMFGSLVLLCALLTTSTLYAGDKTQETVEKYVKEGYEAMKAKKFSTAAAHFRTATETDPENGWVWGQLGLAHHYDKQYDKAIPAYKKAVELKHAVHINSYNLACAYSLKNEKKEALIWLTKSQESGFRDYELLQTDTDLDNIRKESDFKTIAEYMEKKAFPCKAPEYHQLDFWIGTWIVYQNGQPVGKNTIKPMLRECVLMESYDGMTGMSGVSFSRYNKLTETWTQHWVDDYGRSLELEGEFKDGVMYFAGTSPKHDGSQVMHKVRLFPNDDGTVSQKWETSKDEGKSWTMAFDGLYKRQKEQPTETSSNQGSSPGNSD